MPHPMWWPAHTTYAYDAADRLTTVTAPGGGVTTYTFNNNGNQTAAGAQTFTYDFADRLKTATIGATTETYTYAGDGVRLQASTGSGASQKTNFLWDRAFGLPQLVIERNGSNVLLRSYRYGLDLLSQAAGSSTYYYHPDGLGSAADVTSNTGTSLTWGEYYPYGQLHLAGVAGSGAPAVQPFGFTGEQRDSFTGLYHLRARQYDPGTGRFLSTDPLAALISDSYVASYVYVRNNPCGHVDPSGQAREEPFDLGGFLATVLEFGVKCGYALIAVTEEVGLAATSGAAAGSFLIAPNPISAGVSISAFGLAAYNYEHTQQAALACAGVRDAPPDAPNAPVPPLP